MTREIIAPSSLTFTYWQLAWLANLILHIQYNNLPCYMRVLIVPVSQDHPSLSHVCVLG